LVHRIDALRPPARNRDCEYVDCGEAQIVHRCLHQLEARQRRCMLLAYVSGGSHAEVGARPGLPAGTVKSRAMHHMTGESGSDRGGAGHS
jgi:DNA-directed RNA polymerase specialized sigma24 family protein